VNRWRRILTLTAGAAGLATGFVAGGDDALQNWLRPGSVATAPASNDPDAKVSLGSDELQQWRQTKAESCLMPAETPDSEAEQAMARLRDRLATSPLGQALFNDLRNSDATFCADADAEMSSAEETETLASYSPGLQAVLLRHAEGEDARQVLLAAHEARHAWQDDRSLLDYRQYLSLRSHMTKVFMTEADASSFAVALAWQLKQQGDDSVWKAAMDEPVFRPLAVSFENKIESLRALGGDDLANSSEGLRSAMNASFRTWMDDPAIRAAYVITLSNQVVAQGGWPGTYALPDGYETGLGQLPGSPADQQTAASSYLTREDFQSALLQAYRTFSPGTADRGLTGDLASNTAVARDGGPSAVATAPRRTL
jgi:hypothetical protein